MSTFTVAAGPARDHSTGWRDWRADAACRDSDPELFFPDDDNRFARAHLKTAKLICRGCAVSASCLNWALASGQEAGIWGGLTEDERHRLHRLRSAPRDARHRENTNQAAAGRDAGAFYPDNRGIPAHRA
jgi:WhiB family transcriptional regulator, redox-sensing transcriptional regulator